MKRLHHISLRLFLLQLLLLATALTASAQDITYSSAEGTTEHWYVIRFRRENNSKQFAIKSDETNHKLIVSEYPSSSAAADSPNVFRWKLVEAAPNGEYYMVNTLGEYMGFDGTRFTLVSREADATKVHLVANSAGYWEMQREGDTQNYVNAFQGVLEGHEIRQYNVKGDDGNILQFDLAEDKKNDVELYLQFSAYGHRALYDDGTGASPVTQIPDAGETTPEDAGYKWTKMWKGEDYILRSGHGRYLAVSGNELTYTDNADEATVFTTPKSPYYGATTAPTYTALRCAYTTADGKTIAVNADGSVEMVDATTATRATVICETQEIAGIDPPILSGESTPVWYNITFTATRDKLVLGSEGTVSVAQVSNPFDPAMMWSLEKIDEDKFYLKNHEGSYLAWDGVNSCFTATDAKATPAVFRLLETYLDKNTWVLHYVDATDANQYLQPTDAKDKMVLAAATDLAKARVTFKAPTTPNNLPNNFTHTPQEVFFSDDTHEYWYVIRFCYNKNVALRSDNSRGKIYSGSFPYSSVPNEAPDDFKWKLEKTETNGLYYLVNKTGKYVKYDGSGYSLRFKPTDNKSEATKVRLVYNTNNVQSAYAWQIQREGSNNQSMHIQGGFAADHEITEWYTDNENNVLQFDLVEETDIDLFIQFSSYGRRALYDDNGSLTAKQPKGDVTFPATEAGYTWTKSALPTGGYTLKSDRGNYIALSSDGNSPELTTDKSKAATFRVILNPYGGDMNMNNLRPVNHFIYVTGTKALRIDPDNNQVVLSDIGTDIPTVATPAGRSTIIRETHTIDGKGSPVVSDAADPVWYDIQFSNVGNAYLSAGDDDDKTAFAEPKTADFNPALVWRLEDAGQDLVRVKGYKGTGYLAWSGSAFTAKADEAGAALFRMHEYAETGADRDKWVLHYVGATDANQYLKPTDAKDKVVLAAADALRPSALFFEEKGKTTDIMNEARPVYFSTSDARYWYVIRFCENKNLVLRCDEDMARVGSYPADSPAADAPDNMKWKLEVSDKGEYYLVSKSGKYIYYENNRFRTSPYKNVATQLHLIYNTGNAYPYAWQIQCLGSGYSMNPNGGMAEGNEMAQGEPMHRNSALLFEPAEDFEAPIFLQFSSYGRLALYDTGDGKAPEARLSADDTPADPGFTWIKTRTIEDGYTLRSGNGNYLALSDDGNSLVMTADKDKAVTVHTKQNPYAENVFDSGQRLVHRKMYYIGDKKTENKAITVNPADGSLSLTAITPATRATVIRETTKIDAGELPQLSTDETPVWYNILFTRTGDYLSIGTDDNKAAIVRQSDAALDPAMMWRLEATGSSTSPDEFILKNSNDDYLSWDATNSRFNTTTDASAAAPFRLAEYIENGPDRDKWALHYVTAKDRQWIQYLKPADDKNSVVQTPATDANRPAILFKRMVIDEPDHCTPDSTDWRHLYFYNTALNLDKVLHTTTDGVNAATVDNSDDALWKDIKNEDGSVSLRNWDGQYLALNADKTGFTLTTDPAQAAKFKTEKTNVGDKLCTTWLFTVTVNETEKVLGKDGNGNIVLMDKATAEAKPENSNFFLGGKMDIPTLIPQPGKYYTIALNGYLHDGFGDTHDARRGPLPSVHDERMVVTNDYLWTFIPKDGGYMLQNRNGNYLTWGSDGTFDISDKDTNATILGLDFIATRNTTGTWNVVTRIKALGGTGITDAEKRLWFNFTDAGPVLAPDYNSALSITEYVIHEPEDYTAYKIIPKRSWFIKQVDGQDVESNSFVHATEDGSYGMKKFALKNDMGQLTGDSIKRQNTNDYRVVRYMKRNTTRELRLPTSKYGGYATSTRIRQYQRWYNYDTDGLVPDSLLFLNKPASRNYSNGTLIGEVLPFNGQTSGNKVTFGFNFKMPDHVPDDFEYTLGVDMSFYTDFVGYFGDHEITPWPATAIDNTITIPVDDNLIEPTLAQRCIYVVRNAHIMAKQLTALSDKQGKWLEEYNIAFPAKKVNFRNCSLPLDNELANYWIYKDSVASEANLIQLTSYDNLEFVVVNNDANISLDDGPVVEGATGYARPGADLSQLRFFRFKYPTVDGKEQVPGGSTADIEVYAKDGNRRYRLAVYHLTFVEGTELRPYAQIIGMKDDGTGHLVPKSDRSPRQLRRDLGEPKASITFDFDTYGYRTFQAPPKGKNYATKGERDAGVELPNTYRFPLLYENTSYAFEPTAIGGGFNYTNDVDENAFGAYTIARTTKFGWNNKARFYPVRKYYHDAYPDEAQYNYDNAGFLYIDASECPGRMASLDFDGNICKGTRITVSAWVSSPNSPNRVETNVTAYANVFFNILGYYNDENGVEQEEKIYTYCPGPISGDYRVAPGDTIIDGDNTYLPGDILKSETGKEGVWQQIYFSFIPRSKHIIHRFVLNVNNGCTSSAGGDILIDDIEVYSATPQVKVTNTLPVCNSTITLTQIEADYETMMNALGLEDKDLAKYHPSINYCVVDSAMYQSKLTELQEAHDPAPANNAMRYAAAGDIRRVTLGSTFEDLPEYNFAGAAESNGSRIWRLVKDNGAKQIIISDKIISDRILPNKTYYLAAYFTYSSETVDFSTFQVGTECSISSLFTTRSSFIFNIDGDNDLAEDGGVTVCAGSNVTLGAKFRGVNSQTGDEVLRTLPCDWWLGYYGRDYAKAYINADGSYTLGAETKPSEDAVSVSEALTSFRIFYPDATTTDGCTPHAGTTFTLTQAMIDGLARLSRPEAAGEETQTPARPALLLLYRKNINVQIPDDLGADGEYVVTLQPIDNLTDIDEDFKNSIVCYNADTLTIRVNGHAPGMLNGFAGVEYPSYMNNVPLRLTLDELNLLRGDSDGLRVPLREIKPASEDVNELVPVTLVSGTTSYSPIYISDTNDPACPVYHPDGRLREVGRVKSMSAIRGSSDGYAIITLLGTDVFAPREGYTYTLRADYKEKVAEGAAPNTCNGSFVFDVKVVPRYAVWTAAAGTAEWTNDGNWRRADRPDLLFDDETEPDYATNEANATANAFVPLAATNVIVAAGAPLCPVLHACTPRADRVLTFGDHAGNVTQDIEYNLIVGMKTTEEGTSYYPCEIYRTNRCDGLVLRSGAELLQSQLLNYQKAWVEYELDTHRWYTLGTPLKRIYAGDWYAPSDGGRENAPYFHDITFTTTDNYNDRFHPAVYQRGWAKSKTMLYYLDDSGADASSVSVADKNVAVLADWSSVYNDVEVPYEQAGFSLKADHGAGKVLFRLPKEDTFYDYYKKNDATGGYDKHRTDIARTEALSHRLWTDSLISENGTAQDLILTLTNDDPRNRYFLVGNPFPCSMDVDAFFRNEKNAALVEAKYWIVTADGQSAAIKNTAGWTAVNTTPGANPTLLAPGQGFFVKAKAAEGAELASLGLTFTPAMMGTGEARTPLRIRAVSNPIPALRIRARRGTETSEAVVLKNEAADDGFVPAEDMETLLDTNIDATPTVYTLAGNRAATVNSRRTLHRVALGVTGRSDDEVTLTFTGMNGLGEELTLLDALTGEQTPLGTGADSISVSVPGRTAGRYFLISSLGDDESGEGDDGTISISVHRGEVTVKTLGSLTLDEVGAVAADGRLFHRAAPGTRTHTFRLAPGIYLIRTRTALGASTRKIAVK